MIVAAETLGVDFVDVLGTRGPGGEPAVLRDDLDAADGRAVAGASTRSIRPVLTIVLPTADCRLPPPRSMSCGV